MVLDSGLGMSSISWEWVRRCLLDSSKERPVRVISYDHAVAPLDTVDADCAQGLGLSSPPLTQNRSAEVLQAELRELMGAMSVERAIFVGHASAGLTLRLFQNNNPDMVRAGGRARARSDAGPGSGADSD